MTASYHYHPVLLTLRDQQACLATTSDMWVFTVQSRVENKGGSGFWQVCVCGGGGYGILTDIIVLVRLRSDPHVNKHMTSNTRDYDLFWLSI